MAPRGTKPKPHVLRKLARGAGSRANKKGIGGGKRRAVVHDEKTMPAEPVKPLLNIRGVPDSIKDDKVAADFYKKTYKLLGKSKVLSENDVEGIESFALAYSRALEAERHVTLHGVMIKDVMGWKANPSVAMARSQWQEFRRWACEFGMTPSSRTRIAQLKFIPGHEDEGVQNEKGEQTSVDDFLFQKKRDAQGRVIGAIGA